MAVKYEVPTAWIRYDARSLVGALTEAKAAVMSLTAMPFQKEWVDALQEVQLKHEIAGTSRIEGADFTDRELEDALKETPEQLLTRSQRQAHAAVKTYRWIAGLPDDQPITGDLICAAHRMIVTGAEDDHCPAGVLRGRDQNVVFGTPLHRGANGGKECEEAFAQLSNSLQSSFREHDLLIQALALHYHFAAMHPFLDGNGRTARAVEALMLQRAGLRDALFIAMSNYYYDEKPMYLATLTEVRAHGHDLTPFLVFGLKGIAQQCQRLFLSIRENVSKALYRNLMYDLFGRLQSPKKRVIADRQIEILKLLLNSNDGIELTKLTQVTDGYYAKLKTPYKALIRDLNSLIHLGAIGAKKLEGARFRLQVKLEWPMQMTETAFFRRVKEFPKAKTHAFLQWS